MSHIHILPKNLTNQIAAGEVIERPASVVKELVENALDAQATDIEIRIEKGGKEKIEVIDNGIGMGEEDARLSLHRFATSKITDEEDLFDIHTFGFRGEALPSIASVSLFTVQTRAKDNDEGIEIRVRGGDSIEDKKIAKNIGTRIVVEQLFFNIPARKKYLKADATEMSHIIEYITSMALIHHDISFILLHNGKKVFHLEKKENMKERIKDVFGEEIEQELFPVEHFHDMLSISGFMSHPRYRKQDTKYEFLFINKRPIKSLMIHKAVLDGYDRNLERGSYPFFVFNVQVDPKKVDVNVHPRKLEVRFEEQSLIFSFFKSAIQKTLSSHFLSSSSPSYLEKDGDNFLKESFKIRQTEEKYNEQKNYSYDYRKRAQPVFTSAYKNTFSQNKTSYENSLFSSQEKHQLESITQDKPSYVKNILGQIHKSFILFETEQGLGIIDQHAAHEIIIFEQLKEQYNSKKVVAQKLLAPESVPLSLQQIYVWEQQKEFFSFLGFETELIGKQQILLSSVPHSLIKTDTKKLFMDLLDECEEMSKKSLEYKKEKIYATMACRSAVKFGDVLTMEEQQKLLEDFSHLEKGYSCPHGRSVMKEFDVEEMVKWFDRG